MKLAPGAYWALLSDSVGAAIEGRRLGHELRDTLLVLGPSSRVRFVFLFRRPLSEDSVTSQVEKTGTGALNVLGARVAADLSEFFSAGTGRPRSGLGHARGYGMGDGYGGDRANPPHEAGRWPPNVLFVHGPGCKRVGTKTVAASNPTGQGAGSLAPRVRGVYMTDDPNAFRGNGARGFYGSGGKEIVAAFECEPGCPVVKLDAQSGLLQSPSSYRRGATVGNAHVYGQKVKAQGENAANYGDAGGASRFFPQFENERELFAWLEKLLGVPTSWSNRAGGP